LQILQNPKYTSDLNEQLVIKISGMIKNALDTLSQTENNDTLDQTLETESNTNSRNKLKSKISNSSKDDINNSIHKSSLRSSRYKSSQMSDMDKHSLKHSIKSLDKKKLKYMQNNPEVTQTDGLMDMKMRDVMAIVQC